MAKHLSHVQSIHSAGVFADIATLKALNTSSATNFPDLIWAYVDTEGEYYLDRGSSATEALPNTVAPTTGTGRWIKKSTTLISPNNLLKLLASIGTGTSSFTLSSFLNEAKGLDITSAATTDIGAATGNYINVTGTTAITGLGIIQAGTRRIVNFTGILTLTHNATSLILPTAANIVTANGDVAVFISLGSGNWKCVTYSRANGTPLAVSGITSLTLSSFLNEAKGADIASASTTDIGSATGNYINVTGTTTITGLGTVQAGTRRIVNFTGILTLTHNATSLILPTSSNISTVAGDIAIFISLGSGNWKCISYSRASGASLVGGSSAGKTRYQFAALSATNAILPWTKVVATGALPSQRSAGLGTGVSTDPYVIHSNCTIESIRATIAGGCVSQGAAGTTPTMRVDVYKMNVSSRTLINTYRISFVAGTIGGSTTPTSSFQTSILNGLSDALSAGDIIGCEFVPEISDNNKLNGIISGMLSIQTTE